jgi:hypothetical protein
MAGMACFRGSCRLKDVPARKSKKPDQLLPVENNQQLLVPPTVSLATSFRSNPIPVLNTMTLEEKNVFSLEI